MHADDITAVILCGGSGERFGGTDKPLLRIAGRPLIDHVIAALRPQVGRFVLSCGRDVAPYRSLGHPSVADEQPGEGPLGGIASAVPLVETAWMLTYPGDAPFPAPDLVARLAPSAEASGIAVPRVGLHRQNLTLLLSREQARALARFYAAGGRAVKAWLDEHGATGVDMSDITESFLDVDTAADLAACERRLAERA